ncbi:MULTISPECIES: hypothetical protein [unclassified Lysobacter]|uniref:hypothetical protein n=1 Tax=unclassified Lysobacter TaxID=2635362 RepID=UPI001BECF994|nr:MULTISPECIES: hypothetical protein [unclassified Lysobacter]MBT2746186.1 hypothetical protein [Lysobacter sp. ISL-42]MBT2750731.1 hypothetical protein [Lysobacter sp. ISL-50]MBT2776122.1 hypothetical protein [Lysobacter sp. ISL-54]MBT2784628.1 hypothetical protein [Lysobacter sp. ISL-52]
MWKAKGRCERMRLIRDLVDGGDLDAVAEAWRQGHIPEWLARAIAEEINRQTELGSQPIDEPQ